MIKSMEIFVYSGTGNTYKAAQSIGEAAKAMGAEYSIHAIDRNSNPQEHKQCSNCLLGLMAPTIGAIQPMSFFGFILRLPSGNGQQVFLASTGAWTKRGPVFIPGYVGFGLYLAALFLLFKGYKVIGITGFGMPRNWTTLIPPNRKTLENKINEEISTTAGDFARSIISGKRVYKRIVDLIITLLIFPLPILFILFGRPFLAKTMFAGSSCTGCGKCAASCPRKAIKMYGKKHKRPYWTYHCEQCMRCAGYCPKKAVDCNTFLVVAYVFLFSAVPVGLLIDSTLNMLFPFTTVPGYAVFSFILYYIFILLLGAAIYTVFYLLNRITAVSKLFTALSFTHYWRKYKNPDISIDILTQSSVLHDENSRRIY